MTPLAVATFIVAVVALALAVYAAVVAFATERATSQALARLEGELGVVLHRHGDELSALRRNIGTHPAGASNAVSLHDLVQMLSTRIDKHRAEHVAVRDELADHVRAIYLRIGDLERTTGGRDSTAGRGVKIPTQGVKPPANKRGAK